MKIVRRELDIAPGLVDLLFALLGVSLLILAAFAVRVINNSDHKLSLELSIEQLLAVRKNISTPSIGSLGGTPFGCVSIVVQDQGILYTTENPRWVKELNACTAGPSTESNTRESSWYVTQKTGVPGDETKWWMTSWTKTISVHLDLSMNDKVYIKVEPYDFRQFPLAVLAGSDLHQGDDLGGKAQFMSSITLPDGVVRATKDVYISNMPNALGFRALDKSSGKEKTHTYSLLKCTREWIQKYASTPSSLPVNKELEWVLKITPAGQLIVMEEPSTTCVSIV